MRVGLVSLEQRWQDKSANLKRCREFIGRARNDDCRLIIFPEMTLTGYSLNVDELAESAEQSQTMADFSALAVEYDMSIVFGLCLYQKGGARPCNVLGHVLPGQCAKAAYAKFHPFTFAGEEKVITPGESLGFVKLPGMTLGASICYDLRFPVLYSLMAPLCTGAICIANWPTRRIQHWRSLLVARAIENQMFMIGVNRIGNDGNGLAYEKSSLIVTPDGQVMKPVIAGEELDIYEVDATESERYRADFPTLRDMKFARYLQLHGTLTKSGTPNDNN